MNGVELRLIRPDEIEATVLMWRRSRDDTQPWLEQRMGYTPSDDLRFFSDHLAVEDEVWVAVAVPQKGESPLGLMALSHGTIDQLFIDPIYQRKGIGSLLLDKARERSPRGLRLFTHQRSERAPPSTRRAASSWWRTA